jgi:hypothetical protein
MLARPFLVLALVAGGCFGGPLAQRRAAPESETEPAYRGVRFVGKVPPRDRYRFIGRVDGVAPREGFVDAVHDARVDIKTKAAWLGAQVVKIDRVKLPPERRGASHPAAPAVLLVGRAYGPLPAHAASRHRVRAAHEGVRRIHARVPRAPPQLTAS